MYMKLCCVVRTIITRQNDSQKTTPEESGSRSRMGGCRFHCRQASEQQVSLQVSIYYFV